MYIMAFKHLSIEEREFIQELLWSGVSLREIARKLNRNVSSLSREIKRNSSPLLDKYTPRIAQQRALQSRKYRGRTERLKNIQVREYVAEHMKLGWSPEQISGTVEKATGFKISHEAIYQYVYFQINRHGHGYVKRGCIDLRPYLARRHSRRAIQGQRKPQSVKNELLPSIEQRSKAVDLRTEIGHWEDDSIVSRASLEALRTTNERMCGLVFISKVPRKTKENSNIVTIDRLGQLPPEYRKTLTRDRGTENLGYLELEEKLGITCYFAHAYSSYERGSNENTNGLIRRYFPKGTDFATITDEEVRRVEYLINSRPRKRLGWKTPYQVFYELTGVALDC